MRTPALQFPLIWAIYLLFWVCGVLASIWTVPGIASALLLLAMARNLWKIPRVIASLLIFLSAFAYADWRIGSIEHAIASAPKWLQYSPGEKVTRVAGIISAIQSLPENRLRITIKDIHPASSTPLKGETLPGNCVWTWIDPPADADPLVGQVVEISRPLRPIHYMVNDEANAAEAAMAARDVYWRMWSRGTKGDPVIAGEASCLDLIRKNLRAGFIQALSSGNIPENDALKAPPTAGKAILLALIFGDRHAISQNTMDNFAIATLAHSLALSGQHLCIAGFFGVLLVVSLARFHASIYLSSPKIILVGLASIPFAVIYLWLGNSPASLIRAFCMLSIAALWLLRGMTFNLLDLLCAALCAILIFNPLAILDTGLQLSVLCIAIIALTLPFLARVPLPCKDKNSACHKKLIFRLIQILILSLLIQLALLPITLNRFNLAGFWFPLNMLWLPVLGFFVLPFAALGLVLTALAPLVGITPARVVLEWAALPCQFLVDRLSGLRDLGFLAEPAFLLPHWANLLAFACIVCAIAWFFSSPVTARKKAICSRVLGIALLLLAIPPAIRLREAIDKDIMIEALDVGQGQAMSVKIPGGIRLLLDGGGFSAASYDPGKMLIGPYLSANKAPYLTAVFNSHPDMDHVGGLFYIIDRFNVNKIFHNGQQASQDLHRRWKAVQISKNALALKEGDRIILGNPANNIYIDVLHPGRNKKFAEGTEWRGNDASLILRLCIKEKGLAIFPGDAGKTALKHLLQTGADLRSQILFLPHHGSKGSFLPPFYKAVKPEFVVANCGFQNRWNYPAKDIVKYFAERGISVLDTGRLGKINFLVKKDGQVEIKTARKSRLGL